MKPLSFLPLIAALTPALAASIAYEEDFPPYPLTIKFGQDYLKEMKDLMWRVEQDKGLNWTQVAIELTHWRTRARSNAKIWKAEVSAKAASSTFPSVALRGETDGQLRLRPLLAALPLRLPAARPLPLPPRPRPSRPTALSLSISRLR